MMGEKQIEVLVTLGAGGRSMGWSMAMSGGVFLLGKSQKRDISSFPGSLGPFSDHSPPHPRAPETSPFLNGRRVYLGGSSADDLSLSDPRSGTALTPGL